MLKKLPITEIAAATLTYTCMSYAHKRRVAQLEKSYYDELAAKTSDAWKTGFDRGMYEGKRMCYPYLDLERYERFYGPWKW